MTLPNIRQIISELIRRPSLIIKLCILGASLAIVLGFFGALHPAFDTIAHSRLHFGLALIVACLVMLATKHFISGTFAAIFATVGIFYAASGLPISNTQAALPGKPVYSVFHLNLYWKNQEKQRTVDLIQKLDPELISFSEASFFWDETLNQLNRDWPYLYHCPEFNKRGGVKIYSKWKLDEESAYCGVYGSLALVEADAPDGKKLTLGSAHIRWPWPASGPEQILHAKPKLETLEKDALITGDFNATTWSLDLKTFAEYGGLEIVSGIGPSWVFDQVPEALIRFIGLPIDQVMHKGRIHIVEAKALPSVASDHLPILVKFQLEE